MNRETKIGLVTGVALIVLIGAMLSSYLSAPRNNIGDLSLAGQGRQLRHQIRNPVGIAQAPVSQNSPGAPNPQAPAAPVSQPVAPALAQATTQYNQITQLPYGSSNSSGTPAAPVVPEVNPEVIPTVVAQAHIEHQTDYRPEAPMTVNMTAANPVQAVAAADTTTPAPARTATYTVRPGDTLGKIAWHFYHDSGPVAVRRIIIANRARLGSARATLQVGERLTIPSADEQLTSRHPQLLSMAAQTAGNAYSSHGAVRRTAAGRRISVRIYRVESGDTLLQIAQKLMGAGTQANVHWIMVLNHIRGARKIYAGQQLKIPEAGQ